MAYRAVYAVPLQLCVPPPRSPVPPVPLAPLVLSTLCSGPVPGAPALLLLSYYSLLK
jgi:hypothetical protein